MKKVLLSTSAIAVAGAMATSATAAEWEINLGGYMEQHVAYANNNNGGGGNFSGVETHSDQEFYFRPSITLDNGIKISARMDFEGAAAGGVDEPRMIISGSFGSLTLGEDDAAGSDTVVTGKEAGFTGIISGSELNFTPAGRGALVPQDGYSRGPYICMGSCDNMVIKYFTPRFAGFQIGASYARNGGSSPGNRLPNIAGGTGTTGNIFSVGANYSGNFGGVSIDVGGGYITASNNPVLAGAPSQGNAWNAGARVGFGGFSLGGNFGEGNDVGTGAADGRHYAISAHYETGPWGASISYLHGENASAAAGQEDEVDQFMLAVDYDLAKGVRLQGIGLYIDEDDKATNLKFGSAGLATPGDLRTFVIGTGIRVDF